MAKELAEEEERERLFAAELKAEEEALQAIAEQEEEVRARRAGGPAAVSPAALALQLMVEERRLAEIEHRAHEERIELSRRQSVMPFTSVGVKQQVSRMRFFDKTAAAAPAAASAAPVAPARV